MLGMPARVERFAQCSAGLMVRTGEAAGPLKNSLATTFVVTPAVSTTGKACFINLLKINI
jgi:hypothetical protein